MSAPAHGDPVVKQAGDLISQLYDVQQHAQNVADLRSELEAQQHRQKEQDFGHRMKLREIEHATGLLRTQHEQELANVQREREHDARSAGLTARESALAEATRAVKAEMESHRADMAHEVARIERILHSILERLPVIEVELGGKTRTRKAKVLPEDSD